MVTESVIVDTILLESISVVNVEITEVLGEETDWEGTIIVPDNDCVVVTGLLAVTVTESVIVDTMVLVLISVVTVGITEVLGVDPVTVPLSELLETDWLGTIIETEVLA